MKIIINGKEHDLSDIYQSSEHTNYISYEFIVDRAGFDPTKVYSVIHSTSIDAGFREGILLPGKMVRFWEGTIFNVCNTNNA